MTPTPTDRAAAQRYAESCRNTDPGLRGAVRESYLAGLMAERERVTALVRGLIVPEWNHAGTPPAAMRHNVEQVVAAIERGEEKQS